MRKPLLLSILIFFTVTTFAQSRFFSFGFNTANLKNNRLREMFELYNANPSVNQKFETDFRVSGINLSVAKRDENRGFVMGMMTRSGKTESSFADTTAWGDRVFQQHYFNLYLDAYWFVFDDDHFKMGPGIGLGLDVFRIRQQIYGNMTPLTTDDFEEYFNKLLLMLQFSLNISIYMAEHISLDIIPYFHLPFGRPADFQYANIEESLGVSGMAEYKDYKMKYVPMLTGISIALSFGGEI